MRTKEHEEFELPSNWMMSSTYLGFVDTRSYKDSNGNGIGDLLGLISKLDYLKEIGIGAILFAGSLQPTDFAYGGTMMTQFCDIDPRLGTLEDFDHLIKEAHKRGIAIVDGWAPNSTHPDHPYFQASRDPDHPKHEEFKDYYCWADDPNTRWFTVGGHWEWDEVRKQYFHAWWQTVDGRWCPETNPYSERMREENERVIRWLLERGVDGLWIDVGAGGSFRTEDDRIAFSQELNRIIHSYPNKLSIAEGEPASVERIIYRMGYDSFYGRLPVWETVFRGQTLVRGHPGRESHGIHEALITSYSLAKGNQPLFIYGLREPLDLEDPSNVARLKQYFALATTLPVVPMVSVGAECGFYPYAKTRDAMWEHTVPMMWSGEKPNHGFTTGKPYNKVNPHNYPDKFAVEDQLADKGSILNCFKRLMNFRKNNPALQANESVPESYARIPTQDDFKFYAFVRSSTKMGQKILVVFNLQDTEQEIRLNFERTKHKVKGKYNMVDLFAGEPAPPLTNNTYSLQLPAHGFKILEMKDT